MTTATANAPAPLLDQLEALANADTGIILRKLNERAILVDLTVRKWEGRYQIGGSETTLAGTVLPTSMTSKPQWTLCPKNWAERFNVMANILRGFMHPKVQPKRGIDIISLKDAPRIFDNVRGFREDTFKPTVDEFLKAWPGIADDILPNLVKHFNDKKLPAEEAKVRAEQVYKEMAKHIPTVPGLASKFSVVLEVFPLGDSIETVRRGLEGEAAEEFIQEVETATRNFAMTAMLEIMKDPLDEAADVADAIIKRVEDGKGGLREESIGVMKRALEKIQSFSDFVARPALLEAVDKAQAKLGEYSYEELNHSLRNKTVVAAGLGEVFKSIRAEVHMAQGAVNKFGRKLRGIDL